MRIFFDQSKILSAIIIAGLLLAGSVYFSKGRALVPPPSEDLVRPAESQPTSDFETEANLLSTSTASTSDTSPQPQLSLPLPVILPKRPSLSFLPLTGEMKLTPAPIVQSESSQQYFLEPRPIDLQSVVGLQCNFKDASGAAFATRGSGVFVHPDGYILTNRHVVDFEYSNWVSGSDDPAGGLIDCEVRFLNSERTLSSTEPVSVSWQGYHLDLKNLGGRQYDFKAQMVYLPDTLGLSDRENQLLDYAVLKITEKNRSKYFPSQEPIIHYAPILVADTEQWLSLKGQNVIIPGFAFQPIDLNPQEAFSTYLLFPIDGKISDISEGDKAFRDQPLALLTETYPDAFGGRSGSPIFYKGYVVGLLQSKGLPSDTPRSYLYSYQTSMYAILENLTSRLGGNLTAIFKTSVSFKEVP